MLSFTIQVPVISTASQLMTQPWAGTAMTSPGTKCRSEISMKSAR